MLYYGDMDSEEFQEFLPALETIATTEWEGSRVVALYMFVMLVMLLNKMPENGKSLAANALPSEVCTCNY